MSTAVGVLCQLDGERTAQLADLAAAMALEALCGTPTALAEALQALRPHPRQRAAAANLRRLIKRIVAIIAWYAEPVFSFFSR
jgi:histidine ammonia-lyase